MLSWKIFAVIAAVCFVALVLITVTVGGSPVFGVLFLIMQACLLASCFGAGQPKLYKPIALLLLLGFVVAAVLVPSKPKRSPYAAVIESYAKKLNTAALYFAQEKNAKPLEVATLLQASCLKNDVRTERYKTATQTFPAITPQLKLSSCKVEALEGGFKITLVSQYGTFVAP